MSFHHPKIIGYKGVIFALMAIMLTTLAGIDYNILKQQRQDYLAGIREKADFELEDTATFLAEPLLKFQFANVEQFIQQWATNHKDVIRFTAITPKGYILTQFERPTDTPFRFTIKKQIVFEGRHLLTLELERDYSHLETMLARLRNRLLIYSFLITCGLGLALWFVFKFLAIRPLERAIELRQKAEQELQLINESLEERIRERTADLDRKNNQLQEEIRERMAASDLLATEKERLAITLRSIGDGVITTDLDGNVVLLNKVAEQLTGWSNKDAVGKPISSVFNIIQEDSQLPCNSPVDTVLKTGQTAELANHTVLIAKDGTTRNIADSGAPIRDKMSQVIGVVLVFRDVSERLRTQKELLKVKKLESVGILAGGIAHDFNNILMAILGNINMATINMDPEERAYPLLKNAEKASLRATDLTRQLLTFAKGGELIKKTASIREVIIESANFVMHGGKATCNYDIADDLWLVDIDKGQISQVIQNIVINAKQSMSQGGTIHITADNVPADAGTDALLSRRDKHIRISISDNGVGIPENILDKIFDPYFSTKQDGSGLGLATTHAIIIKHDGQIVVNSQPGHGTTFTIYLPASLESHPEEITAEAMPPRQEKVKVLIMDDEKVVREIGLQMLTHLGHETVLAKDGREAITLYKKAEELSDPIDIIIMDLTIPGGMGGKETIEAIHRINPDAKAIVASGYSNDPVLANFSDYGFSAALVKPFRVKDLADAIQKVLTLPRDPAEDQV